MTKCLYQANVSPLSDRPVMLFVGLFGCLQNMGDVIYSSSQQKILIDEYVFGGGERTTTIFDYPGVSTSVNVVFDVRESKSDQ